MIFKDYFLVINKRTKPAFLLCFGAKILLVNAVKKLGCVAIRLLGYSR